LLLTVWINEIGFNRSNLLIKAGAKIVFFLNDKQVKYKYFELNINSLCQCPQTYALA